MSNALSDGLKILGFDKPTIKKISKEKSLEEIFLSTLFMNYLIVLIFYMATLIIGNLYIDGRELNMTVVWGLLMVYPFVFNVIVYFIYASFACIAELIDNKKKLYPLLSVGYHTAIVYTVLIYVIGVIFLLNVHLGLFLFISFILWFIYTMFIAIKEVYNFSLNQTLIVLFLPFLFLGIGLIIGNFFYPNLTSQILYMFLA